MSPPRAKQEQSKEHVVFVRCTKEQFERVKAEATKRGLSVAAFVRSVMLKKVHESETARRAG